MFASLLKRLSFIFLGSLLISACGFEPIHKKNSLIDERTADILILPIANRDGQILHNMLRDRLNPRGMAADPTHLLQVDLSQSTAGVGGSSAAGTSSTAMIHKAKYKLLDARNNRVLFEGQADTRIYFANYARTYDSRSSEENATLNGLRVLSGEIHNDLASLFALNTLGEN